MAMVYDLPQVDATTRPLSRVDAPDSTQIAGKQIQQMGEAMTRTGIATFKLASEIQSDIDTASAKDADAALAEYDRTALHAPEGGYLTLLGKAAVDTRPQMVKDREAKVREVENSLQNDVQKALFRRAAQARTQSFLNTADGHAANQARAWYIDSTTLRANSASTDAQNNALGWNDPASPFQTSKVLFVSEIAKLGELKGFAIGSEENKLYVQNEMTKFNAGILDKLTSSDATIPQAKEYYAAMEKAGQGNATIKAGLDKAVANYDGRMAGDAVFREKMAGVGINDAVPIEAMNSAIENDSTLDPKAKEYGMARVRDLVAMRDNQMRRYAEAAGNTIYGMMKDDNNRGEYQRVLAAIDKLNTVDNQGKQNLRSAADRYYHISEDRQTAKLEEKQAQRLGNLAALLQFQDDYASGKIPKMKPAEAAKYTSTFGEYTDSAMQFVDKVNGMESDVKLTLDTLKDRIRVLGQNLATAGLNLPNVDKPTADDKASLALLQQNVIARIAASGKAGPGKQMSVDQALAEELQAVKTGESWWGLGPDRKTPVYKLGTTSAQNPKDWPVETKTQFIRENYYKKYGIYPTPDKTAQLMADLDR